MLLENIAKSIRILNELREAGFTIAIDDFGSGFSGLSYLHQLPFDCLKIDRDFVKNVLHDPKSEAIVSTVLGLSKSFNVPLVAEGIETREMGEKLRNMGCPHAQGYFYGRPRPFAEWVVNEGEFLLRQQPEGGPGS